MPDTGAPWNIPYVASTDLVSDWPADSLALANAIDAGLDAANAGIGTNVVQTAKTDTFSQAVATGTVSNDAISASITPTSATAKVLVIASLNLAISSNGIQTRLYIDGSLSDFIGDTAGSRQRATTGGENNAGSQYTNQVSFMYLHSPATTSSVTYSVRLAHDSGATQTVYLNRSSTDSDSTAYARSASSMTLIEVAA